MTARPPCARHVDCDGACWLADDEPPPASARASRGDIAAALVLLALVLAMLVALW